MDEVVRDRYSEGGCERQESLCCPVALEAAKPFDCSRGEIRSPRESKGLEYRETTDGSDCCGPSECG